MQRAQVWFHPVLLAMLSLQDAASMIKGIIGSRIWMFTGSGPEKVSSSSKVGALITLNYLRSAIGCKEMIQVSSGDLLVWATHGKSNQKSSSCDHTSHDITIPI